MTKSAPRVIYLSLSEALWGGEQSLLAIAHGIADYGISEQALIGRSRALADLWPKRRELRKAKVLSSKPNLLIANCAYIKPVLASPSRSIFVVFDLRLLPVMLALKPVLKLRGSRIVVDVHDVPSKTQRMYHLIRAARFADRAICVSEFASKQLPRKLPRAVVHRPVAEMDNAGAKPNCRSLVTVGIIGRIDPEKRIERAINILAGVAEPHRVIMRGAASYGKPEYAHEVIAYAKTKLGTSFYFEGKVPANIALSGIDILMFSNSAEPSGRVIAEAQAAGIVVVCPDAGGAREFVDHGNTGFKYKTDAEAAQILAKLMRNHNLREAVGAAAHKNAVEQYSVEHQALRYEHQLVLALARNGEQ